MFTIHEIANRLKEMLSEQKFVEAYQLLFSEDAESIDPLNTSGQPLKGLTTLLEREKDFLSRVTTIHKISLSEPIIAGSYFTLSLKMSFDVKGQGHMDVDELCVYKVKEGKILSQQFFIG
ncbi:SnoaL-like domain-containing protein [Mucilaginibacter sp. McL0603]|uniref:SnoaL-like domain-containing protein n=1 Tax=Mucilaginibacter sp. McL0603 TaxID=3415670 RepID=UPI003CEFDB06